MADRPILFSGPMVRAILREIAAPGTGKTQTRRVLRAVPEPPAHDNVSWPNPRHAHPYLDAYCGGPRSDENPRGKTNWWCWWTRDDRPCEQFNVGYAPGDRLWVRETWAVSTIYDGMPPRDIPQCGVRYAATDQRLGIKDRPSMFMPRWASRLTLTVTDVRVERLQDISEADARAEGAPRLGMDDDGKFYESLTGTHRCGFAGVWEHINGARAGCSWDENPWVVALTFRPALNIDAAPGAAAIPETV